MIPTVLTAQRDAITEFDNRLKEFFRLKARGVDPDILDEHELGVRKAYKTYRDKGIRDGRNKSDIAWSKQEMPEISNMKARFEAEDGPLEDKDGDVILRTRPR